MKTLTDLLHEKHALEQKLKAEQARAEELRERLRTLDNAFYAYRTK